MDKATFLQIFLLADALIIGALISTAFRHALAHFKPQKHDAEKVKQPVQLSTEIKDKLINAAQANFQKVINGAADDLQHDLKITAASLDKQLAKIGNQIIEDELKSYKNNLELLRKQAAATIVNAESEAAEHNAEIKSKMSDHQTAMESEFKEHQIELAKRQANLDAKLSERQTALEAEFNERQAGLTKRQAELEAKLDEEMAGEKQKLVSQMETKLADAVAAFLTETLQHNIDLGAQGDYLTALLEEHKDELVRDMKDED